MHSLRSGTDRLRQALRSRVGAEAAIDTLKVRTGHDMHLNGFRCAEAADQPHPQRCRLGASRRFSGTWFWMARWGKSAPMAGQRLRNLSPELGRPEEWMHPRNGADATNGLNHLAFADDLPLVETSAAEAEHMSVKIVVVRDKWGWRSSTTSYCCGDPQKGGCGSAAITSSPQLPSSSWVPFWVAVGKHHHCAGEIMVLETGLCSKALSRTTWVQRSANKVVLLLLWGAQQGISMWTQRPP